MKNKKIKLLCTGGFIAVGVLGVLWHFLYDLTSQNPIVGIIAPIDESIFQHTKLIFFPVLLVAAVMLVIDKGEHPALFSGLLVGNLLGCLVIPVIHYLYSGIMGYSIPAVDIANFYIANFIVFRYAYCKAVNGHDYVRPSTAVLMTVGYFVISTAVTVVPVDLPFFIPGV